MIVVAGAFLAVVLSSSLSVGTNGTLFQALTLDVGAALGAL
jgi:hypothetical protein